MVCVGSGKTAATAATTTTTTKLDDDADPRPRGVVYVTFFEKFR